jgi:hypothetical protein
LSYPSEIFLTKRHIIQFLDPVISKAERRNASLSQVLNGYSTGKEEDDISERRCSISLNSAASKYSL